MNSGPGESDRHARVQLLFLAAAELPRGERTAFLDRECGADADLREEIASLLAHDSTSADQLLSGPLVAAEALPRNLVGDATGDLKAGDRVGRYTVEELVGAGGMGAVYRARQDQPARVVALKVIRPGMATPGVLRRIELEAELLGRLQHPGIAQIYEAGWFEGRAGRRPYFAMEFVRGAYLTAHADAHRLGTKERLELMLRVCEAVEHAHQKGVIHRDLKPGNVLVDPAGQPKVLDFGVARATDPGMDITTMRTGAGQLIGTLRYMSPEQVAGDAARVDTRSDVYALGVMLFELLSGRMPYELDERSIPDVARIIRDEPPTTLGSIDRSLRGDVEVIVARALAKDPQRRYPSAAALGEDLSRYLSGQPIAARADSALYVLRKQINRYRGLVGAASVATILLTGLALVALYQARSAGEARERAVELRGLAEAEATRARAQTEAQRRQAYFANIGFAQAALGEGQVARVRRALDSCPEDLRGWEWSYLRRQSDLSIAKVEAFEDQLSAASIGGGRVVALRGGESAAWVDVGGRALRGRWRVPATVFSVAAHPDGARAVEVGGGRLLVVNREGATERDAACEVGDVVYAVTPDGNNAVTIGRPRTVAMTDLQTGGARWRVDLPTGAVQSVVLSPDGTQVLVGGTDGVVTTLDVADGRTVARLNSANGGVRSLGLAPDGRRLAVGGVDGTLRIYEAEGSARPLVKSRVHQNKVTALAWRPDGKQVVTGSSDNLIHLVDAESGDVARTLIGHERTVVMLAFTGAEVLVSASLDGTVRWWGPGAAGDDPMMRTGNTLWECALTPDGRSLVAAGTGKRVSVLDAATLRPTRALNAEHGMIFDLALVDGGKAAVTATQDGTVEVVPLDGAPPRALFTAPGKVNDVEWWGAKRWVVSVSGVLRAHGLDDGAEVFSWQSPGAELTALACDPDRGRIAVGATDGLVRVLDARTRREVASLPGVKSPWCMRFSADGQDLFLGGEDWRIVRWRIGAGEAVVFAGHTGPVHCLAISADGRRVASGGFDNTVRLWDAASGVELLTLLGHTSAVHGLCFSPDGNRIYSCSDVGVVKCWDAKAR